MDFRDLIDALAKEAGLSELVVDDDGVCRLDIDGMDVAIEADRDADVLSLIGGVGAPPPEGKEIFYAVLLRSNYTAKNLTGEYFAIEPNSGRILLVRTGGLDATSLEMFLKTLESFCNSLESWRKALGDFRPGVLQQEDAALSEMAVRV